MKAEIVSIGTEILLGEIVDTNAAFLAGQLPLLGIDLYFISAVGDNQHRLVDMLERAWQRSDLVITTGGLGPTQDDITREAIAELFGEKLTIDSGLAEGLRDFFNRHNLEMPPSNIKQASVIPSSQIAPNPQGTAPGWWVERDGRIIVAIPGPPREMQLMWEKEVFPRLRQKVGKVVIFSRTIKTFGLTEAKVDELVSPFLSMDNPTLATYAKPDGIQLRVTAKASDEDEARRIVTESEANVRAVLGDYVWGMDSDTLEVVVGKLLMAQGLTLATMESFTGGVLANIVASDPASSTYFKGGLIAYSEGAELAFGLDAQLLSSYGACSVEVAEAMSVIAREKLNANIGVAIAGVMKSTERQNRQVGTIFIGIDDGKIRQSFVRSYPGQHVQIKHRATTSALFELRKILS